MNGAENAGIYVRRKILTDPTDLSTRVQLEIAPDDLVGHCLSTRLKRRPWVGNRMEVGNNNELNLSDENKYVCCAQVCLWLAAHLRTGTW